MMNLHWKDEYDDLDQWTHLEAEILDARTPDLRLHGGEGRRFKLVRGEASLFWGRVERGSYGAWFLRNDNIWKEEDMIVSPIRSEDVEFNTSQDSDENMASWSRFFVKSLRDSANSPLRKSTWHLSKGNHCYRFTPKRNAITWPVFDIHNAFKVRPSYIDWGICGSGELLALKEEPPHDSGRVKWYKKLVKQGSCPPILAWFLRALDAYVILDGHCRLKACLDENFLPEILVLSEIKKTPVEPNVSRQESLINALTKRKVNWKKRPLTVEKENWLLLEAFDDRPFLTALTRSKGDRDLANSWDQEVSDFEHQAGIDVEELKMMIEG